MTDDFFETLEKEFDPDETGIQDVSKINTILLLSMFNDIERKLRDLKELLHPHSQEARDLHSMRAALLVEMKARGLR